MWPTLGPAVAGEIEAFLHGVDTILIGHETYLEQAAQWPNQTGPVPDLLNSHLKVVFSTRLDELTWNNSRLAKADAATEVARLKEQPGKDIYVTGGATLAQSLTRLGLIDEYHLLIHPTVLGAGRRLFADVPSTANLTLLGTRAFGTGAIRADYRRT